MGSHIEKSQRMTLASGLSDKKTMEELDQIEIFVGPKDPAVFRCEHVAKMGWFKARNKKDGANQVVLGNLIVVGIYSYWDLHYRNAIATELRYPHEDDLKVPVIGDLRLLRNHILHHGGLASEQLERCEVLRWFAPGTAIELTAQHVDSMVVEVRSAIRTLQRVVARDT